MTDAGDPVASEDIADQWRTMGNGLEQAGILLQQAVFGSEAGWTGQAADAMRYRLGQVAEWSMDSGQAFTTASSAVRDQSGAVDEAKRRMPDPVPYDPDRMIDDAVSGGLVDIIMLPQRMYEQQQKHQAAHNEAVITVAARDAELAKGAAVIPMFSAPPALNDDGGSVPPDGSRPTNRGGGLGGPDVGPVGGPGVPVSGGPGPSVGGPGTVSFGPGQVGPGQGGPGPGGTSPDSAPDWTTGRPVLPVGDLRPGPSSPGGPGSGFPPGGGVGAVPGFGAGRGLLPGGGVGAGPGSGGGGSGGVRGIGSGGEGGARGAGTPGRGMGGATGMGPGGATAAAEGARGATGARSGSGMGGMPMGGGRGQGDEDTEHQRPAWLLEDNPESLFGTDEMTAPPVIGAD